jgi:hypothetical protein
MNIQWKRGVFYEFRATTKVHLGAVQEDVYEDDIVEFDGQTMKYAGQDWAVPSARAAIAAGFFVPVEDNVTKYVSKPAGVKVRPATAAGNERGEPMTIETASEEEAVVGTMTQHKARVKAAGNAKPTGRHRRESPAHTPPQRHTRPQAAPGPRPAPDGLVSEEEAEAAARAEAINRARIRKAMEAEVPPPAEYDDEPDEAPASKFAVVQVDDQGGEVVGKAYQFSSGAAVGASGDKKLKEGTSVHKMRVGARPVAETPQRDKPLPATQVPAEGNEDIASTLEGGATGDVAEARSGDDLGDLLPDAAKGAEPSNALVWDKSPHWRTRVKIAMDEYGDNPERLAEIKAVESPGVVKEIDKALAKR